ncbi:MAG: hypothetical protein WCL00_03370 [Bacteroidota bacterium]
MKSLQIFILFILITVCARGQTKTEVKIDELPKSISEYISRNMNGFVIDKAFKVINNGVQTYDILVNKEKQSQTLSFDNKGTFIKTLDKQSQKTPQQLKTTVPTSQVPVSSPNVPKKK